MEITYTVTMRKGDDPQLSHDGHQSEDCQACQTIKTIADRVQKNLSWLYQCIPGFKVQFSISIQGTKRLNVISQPNIQVEQVEYNQKLPEPNDYLKEQKSLKNQLQLMRNDIQKLISRVKDKIEIIEQMKDLSQDNKKYLEGIKRLVPEIFNTEDIFTSHAQNIPKSPTKPCQTELVLGQQLTLILSILNIIFNICQNDLLNHDHEVGDKITRIILQNLSEGLRRQ